MKNLLKTPINPEILKLVGDIGQFKERWTHTANVEKDFYASLKKTVIITSAGASTRIEGAHLSDDEIMERLQGLKMQKIRDRDEAEVAGYIECMEYIFEHFSEIPVTEHSIRGIHQMMCRYLSGDVLPVEQRGVYKNVSNAVVRVDHATGERETIFETADPGLSTELGMRELVEDYDHYIQDPNYLDLEVIAAFIVKFLAIHPFRDGNGRISRLLANLCLLQRGYEFCMYSSHEKAIEDNKDLYYIALRQTQLTLKSTPDLNPWFFFFLKMLKSQTAQLEEKIVPKKIGTLTDLEDKVLRCVQSHQPVTIGFLERTLSISRPTLKNILARLKRKGLIDMEGVRKGSRYFLRSA